MFTHLNYLEWAKNLIKFTIDNNTDSSLSVAQRLNDLSSPSHLPEENIQLINNYYLQFEDSGEAVIFHNYADILSIARQCPYQGGKAVFEARTLIELVNDSIEYDDDGVCLSEGIFRLSSPSGTSESAFILHPNPAKSQVTISMRGSDEAIQSIEIKDLPGRSVLTQDFKDKSPSRSINISNLTAGIYLISIQSSNGSTSTQKLIVSK